MAVDRTRLPSVGPDPAFALPAIHRSRLANGMQLRAVSHRRAPIVSLVLLIPSGAASDPTNRPGLAALTADLLDDASLERSGVELDEALSEIGGHLSIEVTSDATVVSLTALARHADRACALLAEIVTRPKFDPDDVSRVRNIRLQRLRQLRQVPGALAERVFLETLYSEHPYGHLVIGTETALEAVAPSDLAEFHIARYVPDRCTLVAVGDLSTEHFEDLASQSFDGWTTTAVAPATSPLPTPDPGIGRVVFVSRPGAVQSEIRIGHPGPSRRVDDYHALRVLNMVLGGQFVSRINLNLREAKGYTYGARTSFEWRVGPGPFAMQASVQTAATAEAISEAIREITEIRGERPVSPEEMATAKAGLTKGFPRGFETAHHIARATLQLSLHGLPEDEHERFVPGVNAVSVDGVTRVATQYLQPKALTVVVVGSRADVFDRLSRLGLGDPVERPQ